MARYQWRSSNFRASGDASPIVEHLEHLRSQDDLTTELIVANAKHRNSPLHRMLEWNDTIAAGRWRRHQAQSVLARLVKVDADGAIRRVYLGVPAKGSTPRHYDLATRVMASPELRRPRARRALQQLGNWELQYQDFPELQEALNAMRVALKRVVRPALRRMEEAGVE